MAVIIKTVESRRQLKDFIYLPQNIHNNDPVWVPPIYIDEWSFYNPVKNKSFEYCDTTLHLAYQDGKLAGRIMGIINNRYNDIHNENHARFIFMDCIDDPEVGSSLLKSIEEWARKHGARALIGPLGFSDKDPQGFLIEGFEHPPIIATTFNRPYMIQIMMANGYEKKRDLKDYLFKVPEQMPELYNRVYSRLVNSNRFRVVEFKSTKSLKPYIIPVLQLMNQTYEDIYGFVPLEEHEMSALAKRYLPILNPEFVKVTMHKNDLVGFVVAVPEMSAGIKRAKGKLFPFGLLKILREMKKTRHLTLLLGAVKNEYRGMGIDVLMGMKIMESCRMNGFEQIESHLILEDNHRMIGEVEKLGAKVYKRFRIYQKSL